MRALLLIPTALVSALALPGCAVVRPSPRIDFSRASAAVFQPPPRPAPVVAPAPPPSPSGELKLIRANVSRAPEQRSPTARVASANAAARVQPSRDTYENAVQVYPWSDGALYQVYAAPGLITDIALEEGEALSRSGPVAAGDTVRWVIGDTVSGTGTSRRVHILVKPTHAELQTNLIINTDRRTYHLELRATQGAYMASVAWNYPKSDLVALSSAVSAAPITSGLSLDQLHFRYRIDGDKAPWRPVRAFDDGRQVIIEFPDGVAQGEMPPLFVVGPNGKTGELVNYRVSGRHMIVDRLFTAAELRMGGKGSTKRVRIIRTQG